MPLPRCPRRPLGRPAFIHYFLRESAPPFPSPSQLLRFLPPSVPTPPSPGCSRLPGAQGPRPGGLPLPPLTRAPAAPRTRLAHVPSTALTEERMSAPPEAPTPNSQEALADRRVLHGGARTGDHHLRVDTCGQGRVFPDTSPSPTPTHVMGRLFPRAPLWAISPQRTSSRFTPHGSILWETLLHGLTPAGGRFNTADAPTGLSLSSFPLFEQAAMVLLARAR